MTFGEVSSSDAESDPAAFLSRARRRRKSSLVVKGGYFDGQQTTSGSSPSHASSLENTPTKYSSSRKQQHFKAPGSNPPSSLMASNGRLKASLRQSGADVLAVRPSSKINKPSRLSLSNKLSKQKLNKALRMSLPGRTASGASSRSSTGLNRGSPPLRTAHPGRPRRASPPMPQVGQRCKVNGCDSRGHLSGRLPWHSTPAACPLYHNTTAERCVELADQRVTEMLSQSSAPSHDLAISKKLRLSSNTLSGAEKKNHTGLKRLKRLRKQSAAEATANTGVKIDKNVASTSALMASTRSKAESALVSDTPSTSITIRQPSLDGLGVLPCDQLLFIQSQAAAVEDVGFEQALSRALMPSPPLPIVPQPSESASSKPSEKPKPIKNSNYRLKWIVIGGVRVQPWYPSPYPDEYVALDTLFVCEFCFRYYRTEAIYRRHLAKCMWRHPPGDEIYRKDEHSVFEVDGNSAKQFCQNLCLFAKLFIANKTLFYEVETFLFYVLTKNDPNGCHAVGYFSKEKHSLLNCNLSCLLVFPSQSRRGYGKFLIDFSYLLSRLEGRIGSPERPLSDLGLMTYRSYWKEIIVTYLGIQIDGKFVSIKDISDETGIHRNDIVSTLQVMGILKYWKGRNIILKRPELTKELQRLQQQARKAHQRHAVNWRVDSASLRWTPRNRKPTYAVTSQ